MRGLLDMATKPAIALDHPAYCIYLAFAEARGCDFVTADESLCRKMLPDGYRSKVRPLRMAGQL
jgi:predicted nucleic acid-binding protein